MSFVYPEICRRSRRHRRQFSYAIKYSFRIKSVVRSAATTIDICIISLITWQFITQAYIHACICIYREWQNEDSLC